MGERHEDFAALTLVFADDFLDGGVAAGVTVLVAKSFEDAALGVPLLAVDVLVLPENLIDDFEEGTDLTPGFAAG